MIRITEGERKKVAAALRENRDPLTPYNLVDYIFEDPWNHNGGEEVACRLADLIEPEERTCHAVRMAVPFDPRDFPDDLVEVYQFRCSECSVLLEDDWPFCPNCGARVIHDA